MYMMSCDGDINLTSTLDTILHLQKCLLDPLNNFSYMMNVKRAWQLYSILSNLKKENINSQDIFVDPLTLSIPFVFKEHQKSMRYQNMH